MKAILVHGLGQNESSWNEVLEQLKGESIHFECPNLWSLVDKNINYENLYQQFATYCNQQKGKIHLCGLSLGGILTLNYAAQYPNKVATLVLIGTPYKISKSLLKVQNGIFHLIPNKIFEKMGLTKNQVMFLVKTTSQLNISTFVSKITCKTHILYGEKDWANQKNAQRLHIQIPMSEKIQVPKANHEVNQSNPIFLASYLKKIWR